MIWPSVDCEAFTGDDTLAVLRTGCSTVCRLSSSNSKEGIRCGESGFFAVEEAIAGGGVSGRSSGSASSVESIELPEIEADEATRAI